MSVTPEPDSRISSARRRQLTLVALFCVLPTLAVGGGLAIAPLVALCGLIGAPWRTPRGPSPLSLALLALALWGTLSLAWSPAPRPDQAIKIFGVTITGLLLAHAAAGLGAPERRLARASLIGGMIMLVALLGVEAAFDMVFNRAAQPEATSEALERNPGRGALVLEMVGFTALAAALALRHGGLRLACVAVLAIGMIALSGQFGMDANMLVCAFGAAAFAFGAAAPRLAPIVLSSGLALWMLAAPWATLAVRPLNEAWTLHLAPSWGMRLQVWRYAAERVAERAWFGWGLDAARVFKDEQRLGDLAYAAIPLHPHSISLQVWLETGLVGALLAAAAIAMTGWIALRACASDRLAAASAAASMATLGLAWNISYGAWQEWLMALPFVLAAGTAMVRRNG